MSAALENSPAPCRSLRAEVPERVCPKSGVCLGVSEGVSEGVLQGHFEPRPKIFQDGNGNGNFDEINSNDFLDGNWESMEIKGRLRGPRR